MSRILLCTIYWLLFCEFRKIIVNAKPIIGTSVRQAKDYEFPSVVSIGHRFYGPMDQLASMQFCTGALITKKHVLTAAHCLEDVRLGYIQVFGGSSDITKCDRYEIKDWLTYDDWAYKNGFNPKFKENDVAIITLRKEVNSAKMRPASISIEKSVVHEGLKATILGWGKLENNSKPKVMNKASVEILQSNVCISRCSKMLGCNVMFGERFMCSVAEQRTRWYDNLLPTSKIWATTSPGDSGGPLYYNNNILLAVNVGVWPRDGDVQERMNYHVGLNHYTPFLAHLVQEGLQFATIDK